MIRIHQKGSFQNVEKLFANVKRASPRQILDNYGRAGVQALAAATPVDTGLTAASWYYEIVKTPEGWTIYWSNSNVQRGINIALILQHGHATGTGGYVHGIDYINPALAPIFEQIADAAWKEVTQ